MNAAGGRSSAATTSTRTSAKEAAFGELVASNSAFGLLLDGVAPWLLKHPMNVFRVALHPERMAPRIANLDDWRRHVLHSLRQPCPHPRIEELIEELEGYGLPAPRSAPVESLGFAVPLHLCSSEGDIRLLATISTFVTALDVTVSELRLEAFLPADRQTAEILNQHWATVTQAHSAIRGQ